MTDPQGMPYHTALYPNLRRSLNPEFGGLTDSDLESVFEAAFGEGVSPAEYEEFFGGLGQAIGGFASNVGHVAQQAVPVIATIGSGALQGAMTGSALGPYGAIAGAIAGGVGSGLSHYGNGPAKQVGSGMTMTLGAAGALTGRGGAAGNPGSPPGRSSSTGGLGGQGNAGGATAASLLLALLQRPETLAALQSLVSGGRQGIPVGRAGMAVPASSFAGLISALAQESVMESTEFGEGEAVNIAIWSPETLLQVLQSLPPVERLRRSPPAETLDEGDMDGATDEEEMFFFESDDSGFDSSLNWSL